MWSETDVHDILYMWNHWFVMTQQLLSIQLNLSKNKDPGWHISHHVWTDIYINNYICVCFGRLILVHHYNNINDELRALFRVFSNFVNFGNKFEFRNHPHVRNVKLYKLLDKTSFYKLIYNKYTAFISISAGLWNKCMVMKQ